MTAHRIVEAVTVVTVVATIVGGISFILVMLGRPW